MNGIPLPYQLRSDWVVTGILFLCFILASYVLAHGKRHLKQQFKNFASSKERGSLFDDSTAPDVHYTLALILQTCILLGFCLYDYFSDFSSNIFASHIIFLIHFHVNPKRNVFTQCLRFGHNLGRLPAPIPLHTGPQPLESLAFRVFPHHGERPLPGTRCSVNPQLCTKRITIFCLKVHLQTTTSMI